MEFSDYQNKAKSIIQDYVKGKEVNEIVPFLR